MLSAAEIAEPELCKVSEPARPALGARDDMGVCRPLRVYWGD